MIAICKNAGNNVPGFSASANANFVNKYSNIKSKKSRCYESSKKTEGKITTLINTRDKLRGNTIASEEDTLEQNLKEFEEKYSRLQQYGRRKNPLHNIILH